MLGLTGTLEEGVNSSDFLVKALNVLTYETFFFDYIGCCYRIIVVYKNLAHPRFHSCGRFFKAFRNGIGCFWQLNRYLLLVEAFWMFWVKKCKFLPEELRWVVDIPFDHVVRLSALLYLLVFIFQHIYRTETDLRDCFLACFSRYKSLFLDIHKFICIVVAAAAADI